MGISALPQLVCLFNLAFFSLAQRGDAPYKCGGVGGTQLQHLHCGFDSLLTITAEQCVLTTNVPQTAVMASVYLACPLAGAEYRTDMSARQLGMTGAAVVSVVVCGRFFGH